MNFQREIIMTYNSSSKKDKINQAKITNQNQSNEISLEQWTNNQIQTSVDNAQPRNQIIPLSTEWDSDWELVTKEIAEDDEIYQIYKTWKIKIGNINKNWVSRFKAEIVCKNELDGSGDYKDFFFSWNYFFQKFIGWEFIDLENNPTSDIKTVYLVASLNIYAASGFGYGRTYTWLPWFYAKLLLKYTDKTIRD